jgi:lysophospholipase L1-like esterase
VPAYAEADKAALFRLIQAYNQVIAAIAARHAGRVVAVDLFTGSAPLVSTITVSGDGFHPSDAGYQLIADRFIEAMKANGVPLR